MKRRWLLFAVLALGVTMTFATAARSASAWKALISARFPDVRWVDAETLEGWMSGSEKGELVLLDVRNSEEQEVSQLQGAQYLDPVHPDIAALRIPEHATVVVYCSVGYRSAAVIDDLERAGIQNVYNLQGGLFDWANHDRPIYRGEERVEAVHPLNRFWGLLLRKDRRAAQ
ncbi:MAG: rhodanese-like domain-containing protein [Myxococcales bacterium]|nr:rhodanese-like domain-containing protein [Myxococcales bacterium]